MKINAEKFDDIAVTSICESPNTPKITNIAYEEVNKEIITHFISLKIKNKTPIMIKTTYMLNTMISFFTKFITSFAIISTPPK